MRFATKVFLAVFVSTTTVGGLLLWGANSFFQNQIKKSFIERYQGTSKLLGDALTRLDLQSEVMMENALRVIYEKDRAGGLLSESELRELRTQLQMTHLFIVNKKGQFIRSTNEAPELIPNLFSFSPRYKEMVQGKLEKETTPIIKPRPEPRPFKFMSIPNFDRSRILHAGVRLDFIATTMTEAIASDPNVLSFTLYSPDGTSFGNFKPKQVVFDDLRAELPLDLNRVSFDSGVMNVFSKVKASHPDCGQCDVAGTSVNGEYYYVLESRISMAPMIASQERTRNLFVFGGLLGLFLAGVFAKLVSGSLVRNILLAVERIQSIKNGSRESERIGLSASDEVGFLTNEFDHLLENLEASKKELLKSEGDRARVKLAKTVAHNIKSPLVALEMMLSMETISDRSRKIIGNAISEMRDLVEKLNEAAFERSLNTSDLRPLNNLIEEVVEGKRVEFHFLRNLTIVCSGLTLPSAYGSLSSLTFKGALSNLISNAIESYDLDGGRVTIDLSEASELVLIAVTDQGRGLSAGPSKFRTTANATTIAKKYRGHGIEAVKEFAKACQGSFRLESLESGTRAEIAIPKKFLVRRDFGPEDRITILEPTQIFN